MALFDDATWAAPWYGGLGMVWAAGEKGAMVCEAGAATECP